MLPVWTLDYFSLAYFEMVWCMVCILCNIAFCSELKICSNAKSHTANRKKSGHRFFTAYFWSTAYAVLDSCTACRIPKNAVLKIVDRIPHTENAVLELPTADRIPQNAVWKFFLKNIFLKFLKAKSKVKYRKNTAKKAVTAFLPHIFGPPLMRY